MEVQENIINRVAESGLISFDLAELYTRLGNVYFMTLRITFFMA
jgi:hypothetical protein